MQPGRDQPHDLVREGLEPDRVRERDEQRRHAREQLVVAGQRAHLAPELAVVLERGVVRLASATKRDPLAARAPAASGSRRRRGSGRRAAAPGRRASPSRSGRSSRPRRGTATPAGGSSSRSASRRRCRRRPPAPGCRSRTRPPDRPARRASAATRVRRQRLAHVVEQQQLAAWPPRHGVQRGRFALRRARDDHAHAAPPPPASAASSRAIGSVSSRAAVAVDEDLDAIGGIVLREQARDLGAQVSRRRCTRAGRCVTAGSVAPARPARRPPAGEARQQRRSRPGSRRRCRRAAATATISDAGDHERGPHAGVEIEVAPHHRVARVQPPHVRPSPLAHRARARRIGAQRRQRAPKRLLVAGREPGSR